MIFSHQARNPPRAPPQAPPDFTASPSSILEDTQRLIEESRKVQDQIAATVSLDTATFENVLSPLAHAENTLEAQRKILGFYQYVSADPALRDASAKAGHLFANFSLESQMREDIFRLVEAVVNNLAETQHLDPESGHLLEVVHRDFIKNGMKLPPGKRDRFREIQTRINKLASDYVKNLSLATVRGVWFTPEELPGFPEDDLATLQKGDGENEGKLLATFLNHRGRVLRFVSDPATRKRMFIGYANRCNENVPLFREVTLLRDEAARLLGYSSHAALVVEDKTAGNTETVNSLLTDLRDRLTPSGLRDAEQYKKLKRADLEANGRLWDGNFFIWDQAFYPRISVDHEEIAEYFPLETTISGMLQIFQDLFGLVFMELSIKKSLIWHHDVQAFAVWNDESEGEDFVGYLYMDLFSRDFKIATASNFNLVPGFIQPDGSRTFPSTVLLYDLFNPQLNRPCLLKHDDVVTLFHELGHAIHDLVSKTAYARFHGSGGTVVDFGEAPSQMLENWCWMPSLLKKLSRHYSSLSPENMKVWREKSAIDKPGAPTNPPDVHIPDRILDKMFEERNLHQALYHLNQLHFAIFDFAIYQPESREAAEKMNISAMYNRLEREIFPLDTPWKLGEGDEYGHQYTNFRNFIEGDYHAGYYGYFLSNLYSADMFDSFFKADPMDASEGRRHRHELLEKGGSQPEMETLVAYLGRKPDPTAFYREIGIEEP